MVAYFLFVTPLLSMSAARIALLSLLWAALPAVAASIDMHAGTGFFYNSDGDLFTNRHVIANCAPDRIRARTYDQTWHPARVLAVDTRVDIAALSIDQHVDAFASFRLFNGTKSVSVPESVEDVFSAGFSSPEQNNFKLQYKWGQIQSWKDPNEFPYINRMRMNAYPGASGSPILDYAGLLIGIVFAGSVNSAPDYDNLKPAGYGDKWIFIYNNNALLLFANKFGLRYNAWDKWDRKDPVVIAGHERRITVLILCQGKPSK